MSQTKIFVLILNLFLGATHLLAWSPVGPTGGSIREIIPDPANPELWYAVDDGALYRSQDFGRSWKPTGLREIGNDSSEESNAVAVHPITSQVYAVRNEKEGQTFWTSTDLGKTFRQVSAVNGIVNLIPDPIDTDVIYATGRDIRVSYDRGKSWVVFQNLKFGPPPEGCFSGNIEESDLAFSPFDSTTIYLSVFVEYFCGPESDSTEHLFVSKNRGRSWIQIENERYSFHSDPRVPKRLYAFSDGKLKMLTTSGWRIVSLLKGIQCLASVPEELDSLLALQIDHSRKSDFKRILKSTDNGRTWSNYFSDFRDKIDLIAALDRRTGGLLGGTDGGGIYFNATGDSWIRSSTGLSEATVIDVERDSGGAIYAGLSGTSFGPIDFLLVKKQNIWADRTLSMPEGTLHDLATHPQNPNHLLAGGRSIYHSLDGGETWKKSSAQVANCCGFNLVMFDPNRPNIAYATDLARRVFRSDDGGRTFLKLPAQTFANHLEITNILPDPFDAKVFFVVIPFFGIFRSDDSGIAYKAAISGIAPPCAGCQSNPAIDLIPLPQKGSYIAITSSGELYESSDSGDSWTQFSRLNAHDVRKMYSLGADGRHLLVLTDPLAPRVFESTDFGATWVDITPELPGGARPLDIPDIPSLPLLVGTTRGIFAE